MSKILAIDYGKARVGIALSDESRKLATRLDIIKNINEQIFIQKLLDVIQTNNVDTLVIGIPTDAYGNKTAMGDIIKKFSEKVSEELKKVGIKEIIYRDETLTTHEAYDNLMNLGMTHERIKTILDSESARIILQEYLDSSNL